MKFLGKTDLTTPTGNIQVEVWKDDKRKGTLSPQTWYYRHEGRWVTSYACKKRKWSINLTFVLRHLYDSVYGETMKDLVFRDNPLLKMLGRVEPWEPVPYLIPFKQETK